MVTDIKNCVRVLSEGGVILYPTDTIWGLGCDATNELAVAKIFEIKKRVASKSMIVIVDAVDMLKSYTEGNIALAVNHINQINRPVTMIYPSAKNLANNIIAENGSVGIRIVTETFCNALLASFAKPIVSTSANISNEEFPRFYSEINPEIINAVDYVVQYRKDDKTESKPSQIAKLEDNGTVTILRK